MTRILFFLMLWTQITSSQSLTGKWKTIDDETGKERSIVEIYEKDGAYFGKVVDIFDAVLKTKRCEKCAGNDKNKPLIGLIIIKNLKKDEEEFSGGTIMDPKTGKVYKCKIEFEDNHKIVVRGYIGFSLLGRSQTWHRIN